MNARDLIAINIVETLTDMNDPKPVFVSREPVEVDDLANSQLPCLIVRTVGEDRTDATMTGANIRRTSLVTYEITGYTRGIPIDTEINQFVEAIERTLDVDRTRGGNALNSTLTSIAVNTDREPPFGEFVVTFDVFYTFKRGQA